MPNKPLTYDDIKDWIIANSEDEELMDEINRLTYVFTSKFKDQRRR